MAGRVSGFFRARSGNIAVTAALVMPALLGFCGLAGESGFWYFRQRDMQGAADIAAYDGALALRGGATSAVAASSATSGAETSGWNSSIGTITVNTPPVTGTHMTSNAIEVILTENEPRYFSRLFSNGTVPIRVRAVAIYNPNGNTCMLALDKSISGAITFWGNTGVTLTNCDAYSDSISSSGFDVGGSSSATMPCAISVGGVSATSGLTLTSCPSPTTNAAYMPDPYARLPAPSIPNGCASTNGSTLNPGHYCSGLTLKGTTTLNPGVYVIDGGTLKTNGNSSVSGSGVTFYLTNGASISMNGNATLNLSAPTSGTYSGILFYGDRSQGFAVNKVNGTASSVMTGAMYFPTQEVEMLGNFSGAGGCMQIVADQIYMSGSSTFSTNCSAYGLSNLAEPGKVLVAE